MKNNLKLAIVGVIMTISSFSNAYAQKIAHINLDSLITLMPESKVAQQGGPLPAIFSVTGGRRQPRGRELVQRSAVAGQTGSPL